MTIDLGYPLDAGSTYPEWYADALCPQVDPEIFYPEKGGSTKEAKEVCARCPVVEQCLEDALGREDRFGIWGGKSERERRAINMARNGRKRTARRHGWAYDLGLEAV